MIEVRPAGSADWEVLRDVRLRALADSPSTFASTLAREEAFGEEDWRRRLEHGHCFLAWADGRPVGCVSGFPEESCCGASSDRVTAHQAKEAMPTYSSPNP